MRKSLSLLILFVGIAIGAGASGFVSVKELPALPAAQSSVQAMSMSDFNDIVLVYAAPDMEIPQCATVPEVSSDVTQILCAGFLASPVKPPGFICLQWQATYNKMLLPWDNMRERYRDFLSTNKMNSDGNLSYRNPRDAL